MSKEHTPPAQAYVDGNIIARLNDIWTDDDHARGCRGREYDCTCGFDERTFSTAKDAIVEIGRLENLLRQRDRMAATSRKFWVRAAKAAMNGDFWELRNRVELAEAAPMQIVQSATPSHPMKEED